MPRCYGAAIAAVQASSWALFPGHLELVARHPSSAWPGPAQGLLPVSKPSCVPGPSNTCRSPGLPWWTVCFTHNTHMHTHTCTHTAHRNTQITCLHARSTHVNAHTCTHRTHVHTHSTHTGTRSATHPCTHSTHMQPHEALCLTPAGARGGRLQCRASAPRCPWTLRGFSAQGRTPEALARGCLKASRPAALLMAGGEKRLGPEGQTEQNHSDSLGAARAPRGSNTTGFCRARPGLNPTVKWPSLPASQTVARGGLWAAASVGPLAVSWASGSSQRPCSPGRPSLHQLTSKPR